VPVPPVLRRAKDSLSNGAVVRDANGRVGQVVEDDRVPEQPDTAFRRASRERRTHIRVGWIEEDQTIEETVDAALLSMEKPTDLTGAGARRSLGAARRPAYTFGAFGHLRCWDP
jgi:hypothetical protein